MSPSDIILKGGQLYQKYKSINFWWSCPPFKII